MTISQEQLDRELDAADDDVDVILPGEDTAKTSELAKTDDTPLPWEHQSVEFYGDRLEVRKPTEQALAAFGLVSGKYMPMELQNNIVGLFVRQHVSPASWEKVLVRLLDPEDKEYTIATIGELMRTVANVDIDARYKADPEPKAEPDKVLP